MLTGSLISALGISNESFLSLLRLAIEAQAVNALLPQWR